MEKSSIFVKVLGISGMLIISEFYCPSLEIIARTMRVQRRAFYFMSKEYAKMNLSDLETAETFFENDKHLDEFIANVIRYYLGKKITIKTPIVKKYFNLYKSTMDFVLNAKKTGIEGQAKKAENQAIRNATLEGLPKGGVQDTLPPLISINNNNNYNKIKEEINTEASPFFSEIPFSESEDITLEVEEEKRKKVAPKKEKEERAEDFRQSMMPYLETYGSDMMGEFFSYWTETDNRTTKLRFEKQDFFDIAKRLATWHKKQSTAFGKVNPISKTESLLNNTATLLNKYQ